MLIVQNTIISDNIADCCFACDILHCKGQCCIDGDSGAPIEPDEVPILQQLLPHVLPYMTPEGRQAVAEQGVAVTDNDGDLGTPLIKNSECAFITYDEHGIALCAIERAYNDHKIQFPKPISCHLYPIRLKNYGQFIAVNYHQWDICQCAVAKGRKDQLPLYKFLRQPLIRRFGNEWYDQLVNQIESTQNS